MAVLPSFCRDSSSERELEGVEHDLEFTELFQDYLKLFEGTLEKFIEKEGSDIKDFYEEVRADENMVGDASRS